MNSIRWANRVFFILLAVKFGLSLLIRLIPGEITISPYMNFAISETGLVLPVLVCLFLTKKKNETVIKKRTRGKITIKKSLLVVLMMTALEPMLAMLNAISMLVSKNHVSGMMVEVSESSFLLQLLFMAVLPAVCEEFVFRHAIYGAYRKKNILVGMILSAFLFGCMHLNFNQFLYATVLGAVFVLILEATDHIFYTMLAHFCVNGTSVILSQFVAGNTQNQAIAADAVSKQQLWTVIMFYGVIAIGATYLAVCFYFWLVRSCGSMEKIRSIFGKGILEAEPESDEKFITLPLVAGIAICVVYMLLMELS